MLTRLVVSVHPYWYHVRRYYIFGVCSFSATSVDHIPSVMLDAFCFIADSAGMQGIGGTTKKSTYGLHVLRE